MIRSNCSRMMAIVFILQFVACSSTPPLPEFPVWHPANAEAEEAPIASRPVLLDPMDTNTQMDKKNHEMQTKPSTAATKPAPANMPDHMNMKK